jgi:outer membrane lipoprotein-sorting protein
MKTLKALFIAVFCFFLLPATAQTADEIIDNYFENTGGAEAWNALQGIKIVGSANTQGMIIPIELYQTKNGKQLLKINIQGQELTQFAFDGETMWTTNFMTMQAEKADAETTENIKKQAKDFPSPFLNYKEKGFTVELLGKETMEGTDTYKIKLTQKPIMVDGVEEPNITTYYFEAENFVPIAVEAEARQGPMKGQTFKDTMSDYQEVDGLYFPFALTMGSQPVTITEIVLNPEIDESMFVFPETKVETDKN